MPCSSRERRNNLTLAANHGVSMETVTLYRAISEVEWQQLMHTGKFEAVLSSLEGKFFAESAEDAAQWGEMLEGAGRYRIVEVDLPACMANSLLRWDKLDGIGPARYGELYQLHDAVVRPLRR
jgi:hypothetical protein